MPVPFIFKRSLPEQKEENWETLLTCIYPKTSIKVEVKIVLVVVLTKLDWLTEMLIIN